MFPNDRHNFGVVPALSDGKSLRPLTDTVVEGLLNGKLYIAVLGQASYLDQFGTHWTRFCMWHSYSSVNGSANANSCIAYRTVGDGRPAD